jgi:hypothetical protein
MRGAGAGGCTGLSKRLGLDGSAASSSVIAEIVSPVPSASTNARWVASRTCAVVPAALPPAPSESTSRSRAACGSWGSERARSWRPIAATSAPSAATPNVPPTMRVIDSVPDATPAFERSTAFIAAVLIGDIVKPMPAPSRMNGTTRKPKLVSTLMRDCQPSDTATSTSPIVSGVRGPIRSDKRPATGPATMITSVVGRKRTPVCSGP